jgi:phage baseplate assembly protein V
MAREIHHLLRPLATRMANMVARGVVQLVNDATKLQLLQLGVLAGETVEGDKGAEHFQSYGFSSVPLVGAEAVVIFPNGDRSHPLVIATSDRRYRPTGGQPGEVVVYNNTGAKITITKDGDIKVRAAAGRQILADDGAGAGPLVTQAQFMNHTHLTAPLGPVTPPTSISPTPTLTGTTVIQGK